MKIWLIYIFISYFLINNISFADDSRELQNRLNKVHHFYARFMQHVTDSKGNVLQKGEGEIWIKRPNKFNWHMIIPDKISLITDGNTIWFYNPLIEQVTVSWLKDAIDDIPIMLIVGNNSSNWKNYDIQKKGDIFSIFNNYSNNNIKKLIIKITVDGIIKKLTTVYQNGQQTTYYLKNHNNRNINVSKFIFMPSKNITLDDNRQ